MVFVHMMVVPLCSSPGNLLLDKANQLHELCVLIRLQCLRQSVCWHILPGQMDHVDCLHFRLLNQPLVSYIDVAVTSRHVYVEHPVPGILAVCVKDLVGVDSKTQVFQHASNPFQRLRCRDQIHELCLCRTGCDKALLLRFPVDGTAGKEHDVPSCTLSVWNVVCKRGICICPELQIEAASSR